MTDRTTKHPGTDKTSVSGHEPGPIRRRLHANRATSLATKVVVAVVGGLVTLAGVVMIVTPGPAFVLIPLGLAILATEFAFARRWLEKARQQAQRAKERAEAMDPRVRRRRLVLTGVVVLLVVAGVATYVWFYDWPHYAVDGWNWVQDLGAWVPELPGM